MLIKQRSKEKKAQTKEKSDMTKKPYLQKGTSNLSSKRRLFAQSEMISRAVTQA
jgi:hypothetical protein